MIAIGVGQKTRVCAEMTASLENLVHVQPPRTAACCIVSSCNRPDLAMTGTEPIGLGIQQEQHLLQNFTYRQRGEK